ncbi:MAG: metallophosphoesterase [Anaerolineae bacterium]|nr:metallophosphoesterase [Anaerolineae bacterium]
MMPLSRRKFLKASLLSATTGAAGLISLIYMGHLETDDVDVVQIDVHLPRLSPAFEGYRLAQISDIHMGTGMTADKLATIADLTNQQQPDLITITGDFVTHGSVAALGPMLIEPLREFAAPDGVVGVLGNHDFWTDAAAVRRILEQSDVLDVSNGVTTVHRDGESLHIAGVDTLWYHQDRLDLVLDQLPDEGAAILLAHEPDFADISGPTGRFDLQLSGHTHGGQINLPLVGPPFLPPHGKKYPLGQYQVGGMIQYTNRGVGTVGPPLRINCRPEVTLFTLHARGI